MLHNEIEVGGSDILPCEIVAKSLLFAMWSVQVHQVPTSLTWYSWVLAYLSKILFPYFSVTLFLKQLPRIC